MCRTNSWRELDEYKHGLLVKEGNGNAFVI